MAEINIGGFISEFKSSIKHWNYEDTDFIEYSRKNYQYLMDNKTHGGFCDCLSCLYHQCTSENKERGGRLQKFPFFIYWLILKIDGEKEVLNFLEDSLGLSKNEKRKKCQTNISEMRKYELDNLFDERPTKVTIWGKINFLLEQLYEDDPNSIFHFPSINNEGWRFKYSSKIKQRYGKRRTIEKNLIEIRRNKDIESCLKNMKKLTIESLMPLFVLKKEISENCRPTTEFIAKFIEETKLKKKVMDFLNEKRKTTQREILRKYSIRLSDLIPILSSFEAEEIIAWNNKKKEIFLKIKKAHN